MTSTSLPDLDRLTRPEIWHTAFEAGRAEGTAASKPPAGWRSTEFVVTAATTIFTMWVGYRIIVDPELDLQRAIAAVTGVVSVAWYYVNRRTDLKKTAAEAGQTTIKTPAGSYPLMLPPPSGPPLVSGLAASNGGAVDRARRP